MRPLTSLACVSLIALLSACGEPSDGYYDANGRYIDTSANSAPGVHDVTLRDRAKHTTHAPNYSRRGYYDYNGNYIDSDEESVSVPRSMFPARGMCRIWLTDGRDDVNQPPVESCNRIRTRVPAGAYVIYGG